MCASVKDFSRKKSKIKNYRSFPSFSDVIGYNITMISYA